MLIRPWDAALDRAEWQDWLTTTDRFGILAVHNVDPDLAPVLVPTHFALARHELLVHLARPNPVWPHLEQATEVRLAIVGDCAYMRTYWRATASGPDADGVPTSYYTAVQFRCGPVVADEAEGKAELLNAQLGDFQPEGCHPAVTVDSEPYGRMLSGIRGIRLEIPGVYAKSEYDDSNPVEHRVQGADRLEKRGNRLDSGAAPQQRRQVAAIGDWRSFDGRK